MSTANEKKWKKNARELFLRYEGKIVVFFGLILTAVISFEIGLLQGAKWQQKPMIVEVPAVVDAVVQVQGDFGASATSQTQNNIAQNSAQASDQKNPTECVFVGSKNSNKYHVPTCTYAKRIKPENVVCFESKAEAEAKGYTADKCVK